MKSFRTLSVVAAAFLSSTAAPAAEHRNVTPNSIHADTSRPCVLFYANVAQPDPAVPAADVFALPRTHPAFAELYAMLITAKAANLVIHVFTTGQSACGQAEVGLIALI